MVSHFVLVDVVYNNGKAVVVVDAVVVYVFVEHPFFIIVVVDVLTDSACRVPVHGTVCVPEPFSLMLVELLLIGFPREVVVASVDTV